MKRKILGLLLCMFACAVIACSNGESDSNENTKTPSSTPVVTVQPATPTVSPIPNDVANVTNETGKKPKENTDMNTAADDKKDVVGQSNETSTTPVVTSTENLGDDNSAMNPNGNEAGGSLADKDITGGNNSYNEINIENPFYDMCKFYTNEQGVTVSKEILKGSWKPTGDSILTLIDKYLNSLKETYPEYIEQMDEDSLDMLKEEIWDDISDYNGIRLIFYDDKLELVEWDDCTEGQYVLSDAEGSIIKLYFEEYDSSLVVSYYADSETLVLYAENDPDTVVVGLTKYSDDTDRLFNVIDDVVIDLYDGYEAIDSLDGLDGSWKLDIDFFYEYMKEYYMLDYGYRYSEEDLMEEFEDIFGDYEEAVEMFESIRMEIKDNVMILSDEDETKEFNLDKKEEFKTVVLTDFEENDSLIVFYNENDESLFMIDGAGDMQLKFVRR